MPPTIAVPIPFWLPALLGFLIAVGPGATDMYLPAFPAVEASFHSAPGTAQLTLASWFAGLAVGQITQGTVSDRFGRRLPLIVGTAAFAAGLRRLRPGALDRLARRLPRGLPPSPPRPAW